MSVDRFGREAHTVAEAEEYVLRFIARNLTITDPHVRARSLDYDLFLPWLIELVTNASGVAPADCLPIPELERLYMDAAWSLCQKGLLRPGPTRVSQESRGDAFGKGYSMTVNGREVVRNLAPWHEPVHSHA
jgi:hypothetical protein